MSTTARFRRAIKRQARLDYECARGTVHLDILKKAYRSLKVKAQNCRSEIKRTKLELDRLEKLQAQTLRSKLERHIAYSSLTEIHGIGSGLSEKILSAVYRNSLDDLRKARYSVYGVGDIRQWAINSWIAKYKEQLPTLLGKDFPGKTEVLNQYQPLIRNQKKKLNVLSAKKETLEKILARAQEEIRDLKTISVKDFRHALKKTKLTNEQLDNYIRGVFAEWEPIPEWFKELLEEAQP
ncbi:hypothetical protein ACFLV7_08600 [Chloroflexota bacterium]